MLLVVSSYSFHVFHLLDHVLLQEKFGTHNFMLHNWPEYNGRWMSLLAFGKGVFRRLEKW